MNEATCTEMTIGEIVDQWCTMPQDTLEWAGPALLSKLCPVSHKSIMAFQRDWDAAKTYDEFQLAQQEVISQCVGLEISKMGNMVRVQMGIEDPIALDTVLKKPDVPEQAEKEEKRDDT
jgi:hypothetical protein